MAVFGRMSVQFLAETLGFDKNVGKSGEKLKGFRTESKKTGEQLDLVGRSIGDVTALLPGLIGGLSVTSIASATHRTLLHTDALIKQAQSLDLGVNALDSYNFAAGRAGIETDRVRDAIKTMNTRLGEASLGVGEATTVLNKLGVDLKQLQGLDTAAQFERIGTALQGITNQDQRVLAFSKIFGEESGLVMQRFFENLPQAVKDFQALGKSISKEDEANVQAYADAVGDLAIQFDAAKRAAALGFAPDLARLFGQLGEGLSQERRLVGGAADAIGGRGFGGRLFEALGGKLGVVGQILTLTERLKASGLEENFAITGRAARRDPRLVGQARMSESDISVVLQREQLNEQRQTRQAIERGNTGPRVQITPSKLGG